MNAFRLEDQSKAESERLGLIAGMRGGELTKHDTTRRRARTRKKRALQRRGATRS